MMDKTRILVTGACGSIGHEIIKIASKDENIQTRAFDLPTRKNKRKLKYYKGLDIVWGDLRDPFKVWQACQGVDYILHLGALIPPAADMKPDLTREINIGGTKNIINALIEGNRKAKIIYASSISLYGDRLKDPWIRITDPAKPSEGDFYAETKIEAEKQIIKSGLDYAILRVSAVMGVQTKLNPLFFHMPLDTSLEIITSHDAGTAFLNSTKNFNKIKNRSFNLSGGSNCRISYKDFLDRVFKIQGLNNIKLPGKAFAGKNFHCGYYADGDDLEELIKFRSQDLNNYLSILGARQNKITKWITSLLNPLIRQFLLQKSDPWKAFKKGSGNHFNHFFYTTD